MHKKILTLQDVYKCFIYFHEPEKVLNAKKKYMWDL